MQPFRTLAFAGAIVGATVCTASAQAGTSSRSAASEQPDPKYVAKARADSARYPYTKADIDFMSGMIAHHSQAIRMSKLAPTHGASGSVSTLANRIINAQNDEIVLMQRWLRDRLQPVPDASATGMKMMMNGMEHEMLMPGMLTEEQMKQLDDARGTDFDRLFLTGMIQHHKGAVSMVKTLFDTYGAGQDELVFKFASDVNVDQTTEIARMQQMLAYLMIAGHAP
ncbi:MAG: DUF305 domain-containing protein [Gemmatimonadaceae bacterium]